MHEGVLKHEFNFSDQDFWNISRMVTNHSGIELPENKKSLVYSRLVRRIRTLNLQDFGAYYNLVQDGLDQGDDAEFLKLIHAITTNVTHLFREYHHFEHLEKTLLEMMTNQKRITIWSCAASIGAEPWSIAMVVDNCLKKRPNCEVKVIASDIDTEVLSKAQEGVYDVNPEVVEGNPYLKKYLNLLNTDSDAHKPLHHNLYVIAPALRKHVEFKTINLLHNWQKKLPQPIHFVFCRNVIIYFSRKTQQQLFEKVSSVMQSGGYLYLGHSESLMGVSDDYENLKKTIYKKK